MIKSKLEMNDLQDAVSESTDSPEPNSALVNQLEPGDIYALLCTTPTSPIQSPSFQQDGHGNSHIYNRNRSNANTNINTLRITTNNNNNHNHRKFHKSPKTKMFKIRNEQKYLTPKPKAPKPVALSIKNGTKSVFIGMRKFYQNWRSIKSETLFESIVILPNVYVEWILNPERYKLEYFQEIFDDDVFIKTLQWKHHQKLLICNIMDKNQTLKTKKIGTDSMKSEPELANNSILAFWTNLSSKLIDLKLNPLIFTDKYYHSKLYKTKFEVKGQDIIDSFIDNSSNIKPVIIKEVLYQSNPRLNIVTDFGNVTSPSYDNLLEELSIKGADTLLLQKKKEEEEIEMKYNRLKDAYGGDIHNDIDLDQIGDLDIDDDDEWLDGVLVDIDGAMLNDIIWPTNSAKDSLNITPFTSAKYYKNNNGQTSPTLSSYYPSKSKQNGIKTFKPSMTQINLSVNDIEIEDKGKGGDKKKHMHSKRDSLLSTDSWWVSPNY